jgi:hypothetical protein
MFGITWPASTRLVVATSPDQTVAFRLATVSIEDGDLSEIAPPVVTTCARIGIANPTALSETELLATQACVHPIGSGTPDSTAILALDLATGTYTARASVGDIRGSPGAIAASPDGSRLRVAMGSLCGVIVEATPDGPIPLDVVVGDGDRTFSLADTTPGPDCRQRGWADWPAWSPDGSEIAFFAAPSAIGLDGPDRGSAPAGLYVMTPDATSASEILPDVVVPRGLAWSPDGRFLAFGGERDGRKATFILERATGDVRTIHDRRFDWVAWSPDGMRIAGLQIVDLAEPLANEIVIVDVAAQLDQ